jgi:NAD(P)-dependent dehydrogenase (short-subunit alcohol dehydrogenase family)
MCPEDVAGVAGVDLGGEVVLVTGSTSGIGRELARALGRLGATVIVHGRDRDRGQTVRDDIRAAGSPAFFVRADLATGAGVDTLAAAVDDRTDGLDVLCNNAGIYAPEGRLTRERVEYTIAVNHLAPFRLTHRLLGELRSSSRGRVISTTSGAHAQGRIDLERFQSVDEYDGVRAYRRSKLANVLFTRELDRRVDDVCAVCFRPGFVPGSGIMRALPTPVYWAAKLLGRVPSVGASRAECAATAVYLAAAPDVECGAYYADCEPDEAGAAPGDEATARALWRASAELAGGDEVVPREGSGGGRPREP